LTMPRISADMKIIAQTPIVTAEIMMIVRR
jgi:hypothetical protein